LRCALTQAVASFGFEKCLLTRENTRILNQFTIHQMLSLNSFIAAWPGVAVVKAAPLVLHEVGQWASA
jgi:hypothetical protein